MIAQELMVLEFWIIERVLAEDDPRVGSGRRPASDGHDDRLPHVLRLALFQPLEGGPVAAVGRVAEHHDAARRGARLATAI